MEKNEDKKVRVLFGLEQQGHIPTIEKHLDDFGGSGEYIWQRIGKEIGWCHKTAAFHYVDYLREQIKILKKES